MCFDVLRATTAFTFSTFQKCLLRAWCVLHNSVHFFDISTSKSSPKVRCFPPQLCVRVLVFDSVSRASSASASITSHTWHFAWQAWHLVTSTCVLRGRPGTISHPPSFCVAGVALMALGGALGLVLGAALCVAGVALGDIYVRFTWQAWRNLTSTFVLRGRRGTHGTGLRARARLVARDAAALCVAGVALGDIHLGFTWQAWHLETSTFVLRGRRGPYGIGLAVVSHAIFVTHHLSHTLSHTIFHTPSLIHPLSRLFHTPSSSHNIFHTPSFTPNFVTHLL